MPSRVAHTCLNTGKEIVAIIGCGHRAAGASTSRKSGRHRQVIQAYPCTSAPIHRISAEVSVHVLTITSAGTTAINSSGLQPAKTFCLKKLSPDRRAWTFRRGEPSASEPACTSLRRQRDRAKVGSSGPLW
ncbi:hypothetical protein PC129_g14039 [Phytophthora cactorum]|uniref:Uncharacterized protein n=1 Tax=Phytophthora cactorum TaxID=29920 RepID=A0A8T1KUP5_9STRA|nr:hypothetical protein Pcac1_g21503 [Phytophthora cactorum]KAG2891097.1 hypothetical protein PC114_g17136 [Phytophthora cactorum]KAG2945954.1 hypothetical protein PC117_g8053 [Phytophthora cactorum]KAG3022810.1 hypothetical protein PC119_g9142 [Phytophthora cactorum]KAG3025024.1 hypothetical protein PC120_g6742 [Phytophthora cactorum]